MATAERKAAVSGPAAAEVAEVGARLMGVSPAGADAAVLARSAPRLAAAAAGSSPSSAVEHADAAKWRVQAHHKARVVLLLPLRSGRVSSTDAPHS